MNIYIIDPLADPRWSRLVDRHPRASVFHTRGWLKALHRTYGYEPVVYTSAPPAEELTNGIVFCRIKSWLTGRRMVSLPFSDHCEPLVDSKEEWEFLIASVIASVRSERYKYVEVRPLSALEPNGDTELMEFGKFFYLHTVDLRPSEQDLLRSFERGQREKIRRAQREHVTCREGCSTDLLQQFYQLQTSTRRRHGVPPQPFKWFVNLVDCMDDRVTIRVASKGDQPIASTLSLTFKDKVYSKYGCSDGRFHRLGGMQILFWRTMLKEKERGAQVLDLGRSEMGHTSLATFKDHWGSSRSRLNYYRFPPPSDGNRFQKWGTAIAQGLFARLPDSFLTAAGRILYRHIG